MHTFSELREKYNGFEFKGYEYDFSPEGLRVQYFYEIPGLESFTTKWVIPAKEERRVSSEAERAILERLIFSLGMVEGISYYKCACPPEFLTDRSMTDSGVGNLTEDQRKWWEELIYNGLGEFMYRGGISVSRDALVKVMTGGENEESVPLHDDRSYSGVMVPVGGGKDSVVSLEVLKQEARTGERVVAYTVNCSKACGDCIDYCDHLSGHIGAKRILDKKILEMNEKGYLNGHIPFSAVLAFSAYLAAWLNGIRYIALSNENSANESTVRGSSVNHQYSKSFEFECAFRDYMGSLTDSGIEYFSLLRPLSELQIAYIFSEKKRYHRVFRSCNAGSKKGIWCCSCPKCMFVYIILSPFLTEKELRGIFGENLLEKEDMDGYFRELTGIAENKPFECVGTRAEVLACAGEFIRRGNHTLLTDRYRYYVESNAPALSPMLDAWNDENNLPPRFAEVVRSALEAGKL